MGWLTDHWLYVLTIAAIFAGAVILAILVAGWVWRRVDGWVAAFAEGKARGEAAADAWMSKRHRPDCACPPCWDRHCERLVRDFDWSAAEVDVRDGGYR
jgi:hypothetical protein